ncbi:MAG: DNA cytosine methyltransferase [Vicinamibacterales bacterium]
MIRAADLFCGAGGTSTGLKLAAAALGIDVDLTAINHWPIAVETHAANHPEARHLCETLDSIDPRRVCRGGLDVLWASPECTHHSRARGGKPINDQSRATAWHVVRWAEALRPRWIGVENVQEFAEWAPIGANGKPLKSRKGETFTAWLNALRSLGYTAEYRVLCAADYGGATTRTRLFVLARLDGGRRRGPLPWPEATHAAVGAPPSLFGARQPWRAAREVIDWSLAGRSIFGREKPLAENTMRRIAEGARRFWGVDLEPFIVAMEHGGRVLDVNRPFPTITTAKGGAFALIQPFVLGQHGGSVARPVSEPIPTLAQGCATALIEPFVLSFYGGSTVLTSTREPLRTVTTKDRHGLVQPAGLDVTLRMFQTHEAAAAMGFPAGYKFAGNKRDQMAQIGNAVEVNNSRALCAAMVEDFAERAA